MFSRIFNFLQLIKSSLWLTPAIFCAMYFVFTMGAYRLDSEFPREFDLPKIFFSGGTDDAKAVSISLLGSMITMATLAISITMVVLSLAASQLGPRLIKIFMSNRKTQYYIGSFFGAVIACFTLTMILHNAAPKAVSPQVTISLVFAMCFANLFVLLGFVHHVAKSSIADNIILNVCNDLNRDLKRLTISEYKKPEELEDHASEWPKDFDKKQAHIHFDRSGYVQHINYDQIAKIAAEHGLWIKITFNAGHFLIEGEDGVQLYPKNKVDDDIKNDIIGKFIIGNTRTPTQDLEYSIRHLVEIAIRALSPGINDSFTAITVIDRLMAAMSELFQKSLPTRWVYDEEGKPRIQSAQLSELDVFMSAFDQIRESSAGMPSVLIYMLGKLKTLARLSESETEKEAIKSLTADIRFDVEQLTIQDSKQQRFDGLFKDIEERLK